MIDRLIVKFVSGDKLSRVTSLLIVVFVILHGLWVVPVVGEFEFEAENESEDNSGIRENRGNTLHVGPGQTYTKIQDAIDNAMYGGHIYVENGTYHEDIFIYKKVSLYANGSHVFINGTLNGDVVKITANGVKLSGFTISDSGPGSSDAGIELFNVQNCNIINNSIWNNSIGIYLNSSSNNMISSNNISQNSGNGIYLCISNYNTIRNNNISMNNDDGICLNISSNNNITGNSINSNNNHGIYVYSSTIFNDDNDYFIDVGYLWNVTTSDWEYTFPGDGKYTYPNGTDEANSSKMWGDVVIRDDGPANFKGTWDTGDAITYDPLATPYFGNSDQIMNYYSNPGAPNPKYGSRIDFKSALINEEVPHSYNQSLTDWADDDGDWNPWADDLGMDGLANTYDPGEGDGRPTPGEPNVDEDLNNTKFNKPSKNIISGNNVSKNNNGIYFENTSYNTLKINIVDNNNVGVSCKHSFNNSLALNDIINNTNQAYDNGNNFWNTSTKGNYWSDWVSPDKDNDGIVDLPYNISGNAGNKDFYPLVDPIVKTPPSKPHTYPPNITTQNIFTAYINQKYSVNYSATDTDTPQNKLNWTMKNNASWLNFSTTQVLSGTATTSDIGTYWVNITVSDGVYFDITNFTVVVINRINITYPPQITTSNVQTAYVGQLYAVNYTAQDQDTPDSQLTWGMTTNTSWLSFSKNQVLSGTPNSSDIGIYWVRITVLDGNNTDFTNFTLEVKVLNNRTWPPQITTQNIYVAYIGQLYLVNYSASDRDTPQNKLTWSMETNASWLNFSVSHKLYGTPSSLDLGTYWVNISVFDGKYGDFTNFILTILTTQPSKNITRPNITKTSLGINKSDLSLNTSEIIITFFTPMNTTSVEASLTITPHVNYTLIWEKNNTVLNIIFNEELDYNTTYIISINSKAMDHEGNNLESPFELVFTTEPEMKKNDDILEDGDFTQVIAYIGIIVIILIIIIIILFMITTRNRRKIKEKAIKKVCLIEERLEPTDGKLAEDFNNDHITVISSEEFIIDLKNDALKLKKPGNFGPSKEKMLGMVQKKFVNGEITEDTYNSVKEIISKRN